MKKTIIKILAKGGHGNRKTLEKLIEDRSVMVQDSIVSDPKQCFDTDDLTYTILNTRFEYYENVYIALNKPSGYECSHSPVSHKSVYELLPEYLVNRGLQACGRLDADTTGLLLLTDDGKFNHKITSPKSKISKTYLVTLKHKIENLFLNTLSNGVFLNDNPGQKVVPLEVVCADDYRIRIKISEGKYHQVKRMVAAASNRVVNLHRESISNLSVKELKIPLGSHTMLDKKSIDLD